MRELVVVLNLIAGLSVGSRPTEARAASGFSIVLEPTTTGWSAHCDSGCRWQEAAFECPAACDAIVDANGLVTTLSPRPETTSFSFRVEHSANGGRAESRAGTDWKSLSWTCQATPCRARIDRLGVVVGVHDR